MPFKNHYTSYAQNAFMSSGHARALRCQKRKREPELHDKEGGEGRADAFL